MGCNCESNPNPSGNEVYGISLKQGFPLSTACDRARAVGSIPAVIRYPNFTMIGNGVFESRPSNAGIDNMASFFAQHDGCYGENANYPSNCA